jgi:hypothetical protein
MTCHRPVPAVAAVQGQARRRGLGAQQRVDDEDARPPSTIVMFDRSNPRTW